MKQGRMKEIQKVSRNIETAVKVGIHPLISLKRQIEQEGIKVDWKDVSVKATTGLKQLQTSLVNPNVFVILGELDNFNDNEDVETYANTTGLSPSDVPISVIVIAGILALGDGPLPVGDALALGLLAAVVVSGSGDGANGVGDGDEGGDGDDGGDGEGGEGGDTGGGE